MRSAFRGLLGRHPARRRATSVVVGIAALAMTYAMTAIPAQAATGADLSLSMTDGADSVVAGTSTTYQITLKNNSSTESVSGGIVVTDAVPANTQGSTTTGGCSVDAGTLTCTTSDDLGPGATFPIDLKLDVAPDFAPGTGALSNTATVDSSGADNTDPISGNDSATDTDDVTAEADLGVALDATPSGDPPDPHAVAGSTAEDYDVTVTNNGPSTATGGYELTAQVPAGTSFNADASDASCAAPEGPIVCDRTGIEPIAPNGMDEFHIVLDLAPSIGDGAEPSDETPVTFTVDISNFGTPQPAESTGNDEASAIVTVYSESDLTIVKSVSTPDGTPASTIYANTDADNSKVVFHISLTNGGPSDAHNVTITDTLDPDLLTGAVCTGGSECPSTYDGTITIGTLASGAAKTFDITAHANAALGHSTHSDPAHQAPGPYTNHNTATVSSTTPPNTTDSRSSGPFDTTIDTAPGRPVIQFTVPGQTDAALEWTAPLSNGGRPITQYHVVSTPCPGGGSSCTIITNNNVPNAKINGVLNAFSYVVSGLTTNTTYRFDVFATNAVGDSDAAPAFVTPNISADNNLIPATGSATVDTGLSQGALSTCPGGDPSAATCKNIVGQYSLNAPGDAGSVFGLSTVPNDQSIPPTTLSFVAARNVGLTTSSSTGPCYEVDFTAAAIVSPSDCNVVANKAVLSTYPTTQATLSRPHLETTQYDSTVGTLKLGAPCLQLRTDTRTGRNNAVILDSTGHWSCLNPQSAKKGGGPMPECPEGTGWTTTNPCAYLYYSVVNVPGYDLHPNAFTPPNVRPTACTTGTYCGAPIIIGGSVQQGIKFVETCTNPSVLTTCGTPVQITFDGVPSQVRPWCTGKLPNFNYLPCVFKVQWLNKSTGNGNNDMQWQEYMTGDPGGRKTG